ncbi:MAG: aminotransferase class V-fold PLP-dependent enzyme [Longimicrobiales bacterium]|nr:aminotransferase class V-fold PLP-dependent enzyme [Longimicrobiales bacterium]
MTSEEFRRAAHVLVDRIADHWEGIRDRPVAPGESPETVRDLVGADRSLPLEGAEIGPLLEETADLLFRHSTFNGHPRFFGYITAGPSPVGILGDFLAAAVNPNVGSWSLAPAATEIEEQTVRWIAELIGYPTDCGGLLVSGGNMANFVAFLAARLHAVGPEVQKRGLPVGELDGVDAAEAGRSREVSGLLRVYGSAETHTWIEKAADQYGLGTDSVRWIETDERQRMRVDALARAVEEDRKSGAIPMMVVGTAGTTGVGAVDPLDRLADFCRDEGIWFHVDGAYGAFAAALPDASPDLQSLGRADSVAVDPHKWLYAPLEAGCVLVRDRELLRKAFSYHPPYYHFGVQATNYVDFGPQNSRGFRALKVWLALRQVGRKGYEKMIADDVRLAEALHVAAADHPELEAATRELSITTFRYVPEGWGGEGPADIGDTEETEASDPAGPYLDALNEEILERMERSGEAYVSKAIISGSVHLRACIVNFRTEGADVEALPGIGARIGREIHDEWGGSAPA